MINQNNNEQLSAEVKSMKLELSQVSRTKSIFNVEQVQKIFSETPKKFTYTRPAKGGGEWEYVQIGYVRKSLDGIFGFNWDFEVETTLSEAFDVALKTKVCVVKGRIRGRVQVDGQWVEVTKTQFGRSEVKFKKNSDQPLDFGNDMKAATTDCLKKCAALFGISSDIYEQDDFERITIKGSEKHDREIKNERKLKTMNDDEFETFIANSDEFILRHKDNFGFSDKQRESLALRFKENV